MFPTPPPNPPPSCKQQSEVNSFIQSPPALGSAWTPQSPKGGRRALDPSMTATPSIPGCFAPARRMELPWSQPWSCYPKLEHSQRCSSMPKTPSAGFSLQKMLDSSRWAETPDAATSLHRTSLVWAKAIGGEVLGAVNTRQLHPGIERKQQQNHQGEML